MLQTVSAGSQTTVIGKQTTFKGCIINSIAIIIAMDLQAMEIDEIVVLGDEVGC